MNYFEFKAQYIETLEKLLNCTPSDNYDGLIYGKESKELAETLADMEELRPEWVEHIEDVLAENHLLQT